MIRTASVLAGLAIAAATSNAQADDARSLFFEARQLMADEHWAEACPKLEESERLDPGRGTEFNLADCYEHTGRLASAWTLFERVEVASRAANQHAQEARAHERADRILIRVPQLSVLVGDSARVLGLEVTRDGEVLPAAVWSVAAKVDPGTHVITAIAPGRRPWRSTVEVDESMWAMVDVPMLEVEPAEPVTIALPVLVAPPPRSEKKRPRSIAFILGGSGLASLVTGGVFTALSLEARADSKHWCSTVTNACTSQRGIDARNAAIARGNAATGFLVAGGALLAAGAVVGVSF